MPHRAWYHKNMMEKPKGVSGFAHAPSNDGQEGGQAGEGAFRTRAQYWEMMVKMRLEKSLEDVIEQAAEGGVYAYDKLTRNNKRFELGYALGEMYEEMKAYGGDEYNDALAPVQESTNEHDPKPEMLEKLNQRREEAVEVFYALSQAAFEVFRVAGGFNEAIDAAENDEDVAGMLEAIEEAREIGEKDYMPMPPPRKEDITPQEVQETQARLHAELEALEGKYGAFLEQTPFARDALVQLRADVDALGGVGEA